MKGISSQKTYRFNAVMVGVLYILGTSFGIGSAVFGGELLATLVKATPLEETAIMPVIMQDLPKLIGGSFLVVLMGISLAAMTVFLYPVIKKDSEELALGMVLFRGALEGAWYFVTALGFLLFYAAGTVVAGNGPQTGGLAALFSLFYAFQNLLGPLGVIFFLIGAACIYVSFYRTRLIPRWLSLWGLVGIIPYLAYAFLHYFGKDTGYGIYLQMVLAPQEMVMAIWLILRGFNAEALRALTDK